MVTIDPERGTRPPRVLVADDDATTRALLADMLGAEGYDVETVEDGQAALERFARVAFDVVLLDVVMPRSSGLDACRIIKGGRLDVARDRPNDVPVLLAFTRTDTKSRIEAIGVGADACVTKPFEPASVLAAIDSALTVKRSRDRLHAVRAEAERLRAIDPSTGTRSFSALASSLSSELARAEAHSEPLACCLVDVDGLRAFNERGGRGLGDDVLRGVADVIVRSLRESDTVARYGGDEFLVVLPATHFAGALTVATRIWTDVGARTFGDRGPESDARITVSLGVALFPTRDVRTREDLLEALEAALAEAKRGGGNRLCVFQQKGALYTPSEGI